MQIAFSTLLEQPVHYVIIKNEDLLLKHGSFEEHHEFVSSNVLLDFILWFCQLTNLFLPANSTTPQDMFKI